MQLSLFDEPGPPALEPPAPSPVVPDLVEDVQAPEIAPAPPNGERHGLFALDEVPVPKDAPAGPVQSIYVHFENLADVEGFARLVGQPVTTETRHMIFPASEQFSRAWRAALAAPVEDPDGDDDDLGFAGDGPNLFGQGEWWEEYWAGMPEFDQRDLAPRHSIQVDFATRADVDAFAKLVGQTITPEARRTRSIWFPEAEIGHFADKRYVATPPFLPRHPVYIISKGRWESRLTAKSLEKMGVPYNIVVEPQERDLYARVIDPDKILVLPFSNLGQGSIPARNWVWEHAVDALGASRHWILDDNIEGFYRLNQNLKTPVADGTIFRAAEDFVDRWENVAIAGFHYFMFASRKTKMPPFTLNSRVYSMILIRNDLRLGVDGIGQWRGRYNEDTDLSLRALKGGWATVLFLAFLGFKATTMSMRGGNTEALYADDGRKKMAESLVEQHPDVTKIAWKWGRWQHQVDYRPFRKNRLIPRAGLVVPAGVNDYGMRLHVDEPARVIA